MLITKIEVQKNNKQRVNLYIDDNFYCGLSLETIMKSHIKVGQEINEIFLENLIKQTERESSLAKAVGYISKSQKTEKEISNYLIKKGYDEETVFFVLKKLQQYNFVDDKNYAKNYINFKNKSNGSRKIEFELKLKGVNEDITKQAIEEYANDRNSIMNVLNKYMKNKDRDLKTKQKAYRHLASRGYLTEDINYALNKIFTEDCD